MEMLAKWEFKNLWKVFCAFDVFFDVCANRKKEGKFRNEAQFQGF